MTDEDQRILQELRASAELPSPEYHPIMKVVHEKHTARLKQIIADNGWPIPFPISKPEGVNVRRKALGLNSLEERLAEMIERETQRRTQQNTKDQT